MVVGEFNSGKSSVINALLGSPVLEEGILPTTNEICVLKYTSKEASLRQVLSLCNVYSFCLARPSVSASGSQLSHATRCVSLMFMQMMITVPGS